MVPWFTRCNGTNPGPVRGDAQVHDAPLPAVAGTSLPSKRQLTAPFSKLFPVTVTKVPPLAAVIIGTISNGPAVETYVKCSPSPRRAIDCSGDRASSVGPGARAGAAQFRTLRECQVRTCVVVPKEQETPKTSGTAPVSTSTTTPPPSSVTRGFTRVAPSPARMTGNGSSESSTSGTDSSAEARPAPSVWSPIASGPTSQRVSALLTRAPGSSAVPALVRTPHAVPATRLPPKTCTLVGT